mmetsp:Transcript_10170/g.24310  ORF Transcript_10170/g.24310 Transcript_10170/m.24310 type:complete len:140 (+) Transcript_10170:1465-1884(+)
MSLQCLSILGSKNEPLYSCSPPKSMQAEEDEPEADLDGFLTRSDQVVVLLIHLGINNLPRSWGRLGKRNSGCFVPVSAGTSHLPRSMSPLASPDKSNSSAHVNEQFAGVELGRNSVFGCSIVKGVLVVPVVPSFSDRAP